MRTYDMLNGQYDKTDRFICKTEFQNELLRENYWQKNYGII